MHPVPAILEFVPYRQRDLTAVRDSIHHPYFAGHGYAGVRVDLRGSGDSEGVLTDEYLEQELCDAEQVLAWIAAQPWCDGRTAMMGISWGGFNTLQVAARRPPSLRAVVTACSTDDRYADDVHYMGGCLLTDNLSWASTMFAYNSCPPDPGRGRRALAGDVAAAAARQRALAGGVAAPPAPRRLLAARLDLRELRRHHLSGARRQRLGRRLHELGVPAARRTRRPPQRPDRALVAQVPPPRPARSGRRFPPRARPVVGPLAARRRQRRHGRTDAAHLDAGERPALDGLRGSAGSLGRRAELALPARPGGHPSPWSPPDPARRGHRTAPTGSRS